VALPSSARSSGTEADNNSQCAIDLAKLAKREQPMRVAEPAWVNGTELLDKDPRPLTSDFDLRPERCWLGAC
jgi:hypothetical protein